MRSKFTNIRISKSILRNTLLIASVMVILYLLIITVSLNLFRYFLNDTLDSRLKHEIEKVTSSFYIENDSLIITNNSEFNESDFVYLTENPFFLQIYDLEQQILLQSKNLKLFHKIETPVYNLEQKYFFEDGISEDNNLRIIYQKLIDKNGKHVGYIQISNLKDHFSRVLNNIIFLNGIIFPIAVTLIFFSSLWIANKSFAPVKKIIDVAESISASNLSERIVFDSNPDDDLTKLKNTLNNLFERLYKQVKQISEFTDNASHQLMTPLTALNTELEYLLKTHNKTDDFRESLIDLKETSDQMIHIIRTLLILSQDTHTYAMINTVFNLSTILNNKLREIYKKNDLELHISENVYIRGSEEYFLIAMQNIIDNAFKYSDNKKVIIETKLNKDRVDIICKDFGIGITNEEKEKIFERFYRSKIAECKGIKGYGLGLSLVKFVVDSLKGNISILDNTPNGTVFIITLPIINL